MTMRLWLLDGAFFAVMSLIIYAYVRASRWGYRMRDEMIASLPVLGVTVLAGDEDALTSRP